MEAEATTLTLSQDASSEPSVPEQMMTMVVVFGGAGFLGRRLVHCLLAEGMTVRVAVRHPDLSWKCAEGRRLRQAPFSL